MVRLKDFPHLIGTYRSLFQFHYGTIKSFGQVYIEHYETCFNSTMVRLKAYPIRYPDNSLLCFNSTMVRLKAVLPYEDLYIRDKFQFHYGTIKS